MPPATVQGCAQNFKEERLDHILWAYTLLIFFLFSFKYFSQQSAYNFGWSCGIKHTTLPWKHVLFWILTIRSRDQEHAAWHSQKPIRSKHSDRPPCKMQTIHSFKQFTIPKFCVRDRMFFFPRSFPLSSTKFHLWCIVTSSPNAIPKRRVNITYGKNGFK